jgi:hypothetical protein
MSGNLPGSRHTLPAEFFDPQPKPDGRRNNGGARAGAGREPVKRMAATRKFREKMLINSIESAEIAMAIIRDPTHPVSIRAELICKVWDRTFGKVQLDDSGNVAASAHVTVITGVRG